MEQVDSSTWTKWYGIMLDGLHNTLLYSIRMHSLVKYKDKYMIFTRASYARIIPNYLGFKFNLFVKFGGKICLEVCGDI